MSTTLTQSFARAAATAVISALLGASVAAPARAQALDGILVAGTAKRAIPGARLILLDRRDNVIDSTTSDVFGAFMLKAPKAGKYNVLIRRSGYYPIVTDRIELAEEETRTDSIYLTGKQAEKSLREVIGDDITRIFGSGIPSAFSRYLGPDELEKIRPRAYDLGDIVRQGKLLGLQYLNPPNGCLRFSGERGCAQIFVDGLPIGVRPDQVPAGDIEAVLGARAIELGAVATQRQYLDNSRFGAVLVYTRRFTVR